MVERVGSSYSSVGFRKPVQFWREWQSLHLRKMSILNMTWDSCAKVLRVLGAWPVVGSAIDYQDLRRRLCGTRQDHIRAQRPKEGSLGLRRRQQCEQLSQRLAVSGELETGKNGSKEAFFWYIFSFVLCLLLFFLFCFFLFQVRPYYIIAQSGLKFIFPPQLPVCWYHGPGPPQLTQEACCIVDFEDCKLRLIRKLGIGGTCL